MREENRPVRVFHLCEIPENCPACIEVAKLNQRRRNEEREAHDQSERATDDSTEPKR